MSEGRPFSSLSTRNQEALSARVAHYFKENLPIIIGLIEESSGVVLRFDDYNPKWNRLPKVVRKAVFYSDVSVVLLDGQISVSGPEIKSPVRRKGRKIPQLVRASNIGDLVATLYQIRPLVQRGIVIPLPGDMRFSSGQVELSPGVVHTYNSIVQQIRSNGTVLPVVLDNWLIRRQVEELSEGAKYTSLRPVNLYLPHLRTLSLDLLLGVREDHYDAFKRFQRAMREFLAGSALTQSEAKFLELARKVDYEIHELKQRMDDIERSQRSKGWEVLGGLLASSVTLLVDAEIARILSATISSTTIADGLRFLSSRKDNLRSLEDSDYYLAYKVHRAAEEAALLEKNSNNF